MEKFKKLILLVFSVTLITLSAEPARKRITDKQWSDISWSLYFDLLSKEKEEIVESLITTEDEEIEDKIKELEKISLELQRLMKTASKVTRSARLPKSRAMKRRSQQRQELSLLRLNSRKMLIDRILGKLRQDD